MCCFCSPDHTGYCSLKCKVVTISLLSVFVLLTALAVSISIVAGNSCPPRISTNISITPCNYDELKGTQLEASGIVQLFNGYFLKVVVRHGTPSLCVFHCSSTNTSFTLQLITSVEESSICSPEQMMDCLPSSHVSFLGIDYFGVSVWDQQSSSVYYLIVNISTWITFQRNLTNASFNLQDLWYNAINCKENDDNKTVTIVILVMGVVLLFTLMVGVILIMRCFIQYWSDEGYERWDIHTCIYQLHVLVYWIHDYAHCVDTITSTCWSSTSYQWLQTGFFRHFYQYWDGWIGCRYFFNLIYILWDLFIACVWCTYMY